jgi:hypothetical protein
VLLQFARLLPRIKIGRESHLATAVLHQRELAGTLLANAAYVRIGSNCDIAERPRHVWIALNIGHPAQALGAWMQLPRLN